MHRMLPLPGRLSRSARPSQAPGVHWATVFCFCRRAGNAPSRHRRSTIGTKEAGGIGYWNITKCCTKVCPENITITDNAIIPLKERVVDEFYDPLRFLLKLFRPKT